MTTKVVRLIRDHQRKDLNNFFEVYSLAGGSWSDPCSLDHVYDFNSNHRAQAFVNGAIHWIAFCNLADGGSKCFILVFDVGSDSFHRIMVPKNFRSSWADHLSISDYGKSIALSKHYITNTKEPYLEIWVMKEYGMEESWTKLTTLCQPGPQIGVPYRPLCFRKSGDLVLVPILCCLDVDDDSYELVCLDPASKQCTNLGIRGYVCYYAEYFVESLVLLDKTDAVSY